MSSFASRLFSHLKFNVSIRDGDTMSYSSSSMNKYWIPSQDIHKKVITQELQYHLGPQATVRPYTREVCEPIPEAMTARAIDKQLFRLAGRRWISHHDSWPVPVGCKPRSDPDRREPMLREPALTLYVIQEQIDDICQKSREMWELKAAARATDSSPEKPLKRPLHQPVVMAKAGYTSQHRR